MVMKVSDGIFCDLRHGIMGSVLACITARHHRRIGEDHRTDLPTPFPQLAGGFDCG